MLGVANGLHDPHEDSTSPEHAKRMYHNKLIEAEHNSMQELQSPHKLVHLQIDKHACKITQFFKMAVLKNRERRVGEAKNPGPLAIRTFNPTQLLGHEETISQWGDGIWTACETAHTAAASPVICHRFHKHGVRSILSPPVPRHTENGGAYRGKASGTGIFSNFSMHPYPMQVDPVVNETSRFCDAVVNLHNGSHLYVCSVYGPPITNYTYDDAERVFHAVFRQGMQRAMAFRGPAVITGDLNRDLCDIQEWQILKLHGWKDCAELAWELHGHAPEPTYRENSRRSFVLINEAMIPYFQMCQTVDHHVFAQHPILEASFNIGNMPLTRIIWNLPKSMDEVMLDPEILNDPSHISDNRERFFHDSIQSGDMNAAVRHIALAFDECCSAAAVTTDGHSTKIPQACFQRCRKKLVNKHNISAPVVKHARSGDLNIGVGQCSISLRRRTMQVRRLQSLRRQLQALQRTGSEQCRSSCAALWITICNANGFAGGFPSWCMTTFGETMRWMDANAQAVAMFGVVPDDNDAFNMKKPLQQPLSKQMPLRDAGDAESVVVFTDGTCYFGEHWDCALAGAAVILADYDCNRATEVMRFLLPSHDHSAFRAESFAVLAVLQKWYAVTIVTDCSAVITLLELLMDQKSKSKMFQFDQHGDVWDVIAWHISNRDHGVVKVRKIKARQDVSMLQPGVERFEASCNDMADKSAKKAVCCDHFDLWQAMQRIVDRRNATKTMVNNVHSFLCDLHISYFTQCEQMEGSKQEVGQYSIPSVVAPFVTLPVPSPEQIRRSPFGVEFSNAFARWASDLRSIIYGRHL
eukprot:Skav224790  [mRNA]  locus=scaffold764:105032:110713:- [translate_table: standard]